MIIPTVFGAFDTVTKGLSLEGLEIAGQVEIVQTTILLKTARIQRRVQEKAEEAMEHEGDGDTNCCWHSWNDPKEII